MLRDSRHSRPAMLLRVAGLLLLIVWQIEASDHHAGFHGRGLAITIMLAIALAAWVRGLSKAGPMTDPIVRGLPWEVYVMAASGGALIGASPSGPANFLVFMSAFIAGGRVSVPRGFIITVVAILAVCVSWIVYNQGGLGPIAYALGLIATTFGGSQRYEGMVRREQAELLLAQTQRSNEEQVRNARLQESTRIAREIHDVLAHSLAGLTIQLEATVALLEAGADREDVIERVRRAHALARDGMRETRLAVGALRDGAAFVPTTSRIEALVADFRATGNDVTLAVDGPPDALAGDRGDAVVRIIQEALTNVTKHAPGSEVVIRIEAGPPLSVSIENRCATPLPATVDPSSLAATGGGYGLSGMRERASELGGSLQAGPTGEGWRVELSLP